MAASSRCLVESSHSHLAWMVTVSSNTNSKSSLPPVAVAVGRSHAYPSAWQIEIVAASALFSPAGAGLCSCSCEHALLPRSHLHPRKPTRRPACRSCSALASPSPDNASVGVCVGLDTHHYHCIEDQHHLCTFAISLAHIYERLASLPVWRNTGRLHDH